MPNEPLNLRQLMSELEAFAQRRPESLDWPVHILDMEGDELHGRGDPEWAGLVTKVEEDAFAENQGRVVSLLAWHDEPENTKRREEILGATDVKGN